MTSIELRLQRHDIHDIIVNVTTMSTNSPWSHLDPLGKFVFAPVPEVEGLKQMVRSLMPPDLLSKPLFACLIGMGFKQTWLSKLTPDLHGNLSLETF